MKGPANQAVRWAIILTVINGITGILFVLLWPDLDDRGTVIAVGAVFTILMLIASWLCWSGIKFGGWALVVVNVLNVLLTLPSYFSGQDAAFIIGGTVSLVLSVAALVLLLMPSTRPAWKARA